MLGIFRTDRRPLGLLFHCFVLLFGWLDLGLGVPFALGGGVFGSGERRGARVGPRERAPETA